MGPCADNTHARPNCSTPECRCRPHGRRTHDGGAHAGVSRVRAARARSAGIRPLRALLAYAAVTLAGVAMIVAGLPEMRASGAAHAPLPWLGLLAALLGAVGSIAAARHASQVRRLRSGRTAIARWTVPAAEFEAFRAAEARIPARSVVSNFYRLPRRTPAEGIEVAFSASGVLIGDGYFPLATHGGRRLENVSERADPPAIEFTTAFHRVVRTSSATYTTQRKVHALRVPVARDARREAGEVASAYRALLARE